MRSSIVFALSLLALAPSCGGNMPPSAVRVETGEVRLDLPSDTGQLVTVPSGGSGTTARAFVVDFWAPSCVPCRKSVPALDAMRRELRANGVELHLVAVLSEDETTESAKKTLRSWGVDSPFLVDRVGASRAAAGVTALPATLVLDRKGTVRWSAPLSAPTADVVTSATMVASEE